MLGGGGGGGGSSSSGGGDGGASSPSMLRDERQFALAPLPSHIGRRSSSAFTLADARVHISYNLRPPPSPPSRDYPLLAARTRARKATNRQLSMWRAALFLQFAACIWVDADG